MPDLAVRGVDHLSRVLSDIGVKHFFAVNGGAAVNIIDSLVEVGGLEAVFHHHEQAAALAAEAYGRAVGLGVCVVTTGPGVSNSLTGVVTAWQDSVPLLVISGQARTSTLGIGFPVRQAGTQHLDVEPLVKSIVKKFVRVEEYSEIRETVLELVSLAKSPRCGPVWLDYPLDLQLSRSSEPGTHQGDAIAVSSELPTASADTNHFMAELQKSLSSSEKPVILVGRGCQDVDQEALKKITSHIGSPIVGTWGAINFEIENHPDYIGRVGVSGQREANKTLNEADLILSLGARLCQSVTGPDLSLFAPSAKIFVIDVDHAELEFLSSRRSVFPAHADLREFVPELERHLRRSRTTKEKARWNAELKPFDFEAEYGNLRSHRGEVDLYHIFRVLDIFSRENSDMVVIDGGGTVVYASMQVMKTSRNRQIFIPAATAPMGTGLAHAIGVSKARVDHHIWAVVGDGSMMMNLQELQTIVSHGLSVGIVVVNNEGYRSIRMTQEQFAGNRLHGADAGWGLSIPDFESLSKSFGLGYQRVTDLRNLERALAFVRKLGGPHVVEIMGKVDQEIFPRIKFVQNSDGSNTALALSEMHPDESRS